MRARCASRRALPGDPLTGAWQPGAPLGEPGSFDTRRRNRVNGVVRAVDGDVLTIAVEQSFGNCAKYIQGRKPTLVTREVDASVEPDVSDALNDADRALLAQADTFFVASANTSADAAPRAARTCRIAAGCRVSCASTTRAR